MQKLLIGPEPFFVDFTVNILPPIRRHKLRDARCARRAHMV